MVTKFDFDDILITPKKTTEINSRYEDIELEYFPIFTAPMDTVINSINAELFRNNKINICLPRGYYEQTTDEYFYSFSLKEFESIFLQEKIDSIPFKRVCIDTANGHLSSLLRAIEKAKSIYGTNIQIMAGNIANPHTIKEYESVSCDFARLGIGFGAGCLTSQNVGVGYPMASLVQETKSISNGTTKIIADGGFKKYSDIIKALALGADYVMLGSILNKCLESCSPTFTANSERTNQYEEETKQRFKSGEKLFKSFRGMSTKEVQREWSKTKLRTSEGVHRTWQVESTIDSWTENMEAYLRSAMSYSNANNLSEFIGKADVAKITQNSLNRFSK